MNTALLSPAYYAGFFDGEGSVGLYKLQGKNGVGIVLSTEIVNTYEGVLKPLPELFGGIITKKESKNPLWQDAYRWRLSSDKAITFLEWIHPYTVVKHKQISTVFEFWSKTNKDSSRNKYNTMTMTEIQYYIDQIKILKR